MRQLNHQAHCGFFKEESIFAGSTFAWKGGWMGSVGGDMLLCGCRKWVGWKLKFCHCFLLGAKLNEGCGSHLGGCWDRKSNL